MNRVFLDLDADGISKNMTVAEVIDLMHKQGFEFKFKSQNFGWALQQLNNNLLVARDTWEHGQCLFLIRGRTVDYNIFQSWKNNANPAYDPPRDIEILDHIDMRMSNGKYLTGWTPSQEDMLATDWRIYRNSLALQKEEKR